MGYFDDAKASREEENTLEHSSGAWKKHKYIQKIGEGANAVYKYSKKAADKVTYAAKHPHESITGRDMKLSKEYWELESDVAGSNAQLNHLPDADRHRSYRQAERAGRMAALEDNEYYTKSLAGKASKTVARGKALIKDFFTPKTKVTASSNLTGKETINTKPAEKVTLKKNKLSFKKKSSNQDNNSNTFTLGPDGTTQAPNNGKWRKVK